MKDENFLSRWSRLKRRGGAAEPAPPATPPAPPPVPAASTPAVAAAGAAAPDAAPANREQPPALPPLESLSGDSDFSAFMHEKVDETVRRAALKKLFSDPRFNIMDGLDVYIDDYSKPDPLPPDWLAKMNQVSHLVVHDEPEGDGEKVAQAPGEEAQAAGEEARGAAPEPADRQADQALARGCGSEATPQPDPGAPSPESPQEPPAP